MFIKIGNWTVNTDQIVRILQNGDGSLTVYLRSGGDDFKIVVAADIAIAFLHALQPIVLG